MIRYYDDILVTKLQRWMPEASKLRILNPDETKRFFELNAEDNNDKKVQLPFITLSRDPNITLASNIKREKSFNGLKLESTKTDTLLLNVIPIELNYQLDIYTKTAEEMDEYLRNFVFKLVNNPEIKVLVPFNSSEYIHKAYIRLLPELADTKDISEHLFSGQFYRWTIKLEIQDAFLFNVPYKKNWKLVEVGVELSDSLQEKGDIEVVYEKID